MLKAKKKPKGMSFAARAATASGALSLMFAGILGVSSATAVDTGSSPLDDDSPQTVYDDGVDERLDALAVELRETVAEETAAREASKDNPETAKSRAISAKGPGYITGPKAASDGVEAGSGYEWNYTIGDAAIHWLGPLVLPGSSFVEWCVDFSSLQPEGPGELEAATPSASPYPELQQIQVLNSEHMGYILNRWAKDINTINQANYAERLAAISIIVHATYEPRSADESYMLGFRDTLSETPAGRTLYKMAKEMVDAAESVGGELKGQGVLNVLPNKQDFVIDNIGVAAMPKGVLLGGIDVTVTITSDNAVFDKGTIPNGSVSSDGKTWTGKTAEEYLSVRGHSTANGKISVKVTFGKVARSVAQELVRANGTQNTVRFTESASDPSVPTNPTQTIVFDFQPMLVSDTETAGGHIMAPGSKQIKDHLSVFTDKSYKQTAWLGVNRTYPGQPEYAPLPVTFTGTAYDLGERPVGELNEVPDGAKVLGQVTIVANGESEHDVSLDVDGEPRFVTWVWEMSKFHQPEMAPEELYMLAGPWKDHYGIEEEQGVTQWPGDIESNIKVHPTNKNTYLVDDVWVTELPTDYPTFEGGFGFDADTKVITQSLYFWPNTKKEDVKSLVGATKIGSVQIPAKNGFYPSVGDLEFKMPKGDDDKPMRGTYQFVHSFVGGAKGRVPSFTSKVPDYFEMFEVKEGPAISTTATGSADHNHGAYEEAKITDTVCYVNLDISKEYEVKGILMNQSTGKPLLSNGEEVTASKKFTPASSEGCVDLDFIFDASALAGETTVVFEDLFEDKIKVATHSEIDDEGQTIWFPELHTTAMGTEDDIVLPDEEVTITDKVAYTNLIPGKQYTLKGVLMNQETGKEFLVDGKPITSEVTFTPSAKNGSVDMVFKFNASALAGSTVVVFEDLFLKGVNVGTHSDIDDEGQTVYIPEIGTTAMGSVEDLVLADHEVTIVDKVEYKSLAPGKEYTVKGVLMVKDTGKELLVDGKPVTAETTFIPETPNGFVDIVFTFNASALAGQVVVAFEDAYYEDLLVATHSDIEDEGQTVYIPDLKTTATGPDGGKTVPAAETVLTDEVCYTALSPGKEYELTGTLMDKTTGKPFQVNGKPLTSSSKFTPKESDGCTTIDFKFNAVDLAGREVVVFEDLFRESVKVGTHSDIEDKGQTVRVDPAAPLAKTGATVGLIFLGTVLLGGAGIALTLVARRRNNG